MASQVQTVTGPVDADQLGTTLIHEHLRNKDEAVDANWPTNAVSVKEDAPYEVAPDQTFEIAVREAKAAVDLGIKTIGEPTAMFLGRDVEFLRRVSEQTGLQVIPCTGIYTYDPLPQFFLNREPDQIADLFVADIEEGIQGTDIKAAFIKVAADEPGVTENIEKVHRAAALASVRTGAPIMAHSRPASNTGPRQVEIFEEEGVDLSKVQIAHTGDTDDLDYIEALLEKGVWIGLDRYGLELFLPYERRQETAKELLERGYADRMFLSSDSVATTDWFPPNVIERLIETGAAKEWTIRIVPEKVLPELREWGLTEQQERTLMVDNPVRWLTG
jgi:phosphotriesterase-related protein